MNSAESRPTKNQKRQEARDKARAMREAQSKRAKRSKVLIQSALALGIITIIAVVTIFIISSLRPPGPGPLNMQSDGIKIGAGFKAVPTPALSADAMPILSEPNPDGVKEIHVFVDYSCPACASFEIVNGPLLKTWIENGTATVEYHLLAFRDAQTAGTRYATRAANSAACVAEHSPDSFFIYNDLLLANQPVPPASVELTNAQLVQLVQQSGATNLPEIERCVRDETFANWIGQATKRAMDTGPLPVRNSEVPLVTFTPSVFVDGKLWRPEVQPDLASFVASLENGD